ncbi:MAG: glycine cleavage system protein GcvH [Thermoplasmata archaeon]
MTEGKIPPELRYTATHEWVRVEGDLATIGITDHAQSELTDIVFVDLPPIGKAATAGASLLILESVKTVADVYAIGTGSVAEANAELKTHPEYINSDPYGKGWLVRIRLSAPVDPARLLSPDAYRELVAKGA